MRDNKLLLRLVSLLAVALIAFAACGEDEEPTTGTGGGDNGDAGITSVDDLAGKRVAVQTATTGAFYAQENFPDAEIVQFPKAPSMYQALQAGQVDAVFNDLPVSIEAIKGKDNLEIVEQIDTGEQYAMAVNKENSALKDAIDAALENMYADGSYAEIYSKYFPEQELPEWATEGGGETGEIPDGDFTLATEGHLVVGSDIPYPPFEFEDAGGKLTGFDVELVRGVAEQLGLENADNDWISTNFDTIFLQLQKGARFDIVVAAVTAYAPDGSPASETVAERRKLVDFTLPYYPSLQSLTVNTGG
jgi:ABC-type amino acid transport substrate-binding protein